MATAAQARARAGEFVDTPALAGDPVPVVDAAGRQAAWFVPLVDAGLLLGFVELLPDLTHRRTSWFGQPPGSPQGCPSAASWLDPTVVAARARPHLAPGEVAGEPALSFDGTPDRLAWAVPVGGPSGPRIIWVAGNATWTGPAATGLG